MKLLIGAVSRPKFVLHQFLHLAVHTKAVINGFKWYLFTCMKKIHASSSSLWQSEVLLSIPKQDSTWFNERHHLSVFWFLELLNKKAPLLRCSCRIGWKRWSVLMTSSMSMACCVIACSVSKGGYTGQHESYNKSATKIQLWSPIT